MSRQHRFSLTMYMKTSFSRTCYICYMIMRRLTLEMERMDFCHSHSGSISVSAPIRWNAGHLFVARSFYLPCCYFFQLQIFSMVFVIVLTGVNMLVIVSVCEGISRFWTYADIYNHTSGGPGCTTFHTSTQVCWMVYIRR